MKLHMLLRWVQQQCYKTIEMGKTNVKQQVSMCWQNFFGFTWHSNVDICFLGETFVCVWCCSCILTFFAVGKIMMSVNSSNNACVLWEWFRCDLNIVCVFQQSATGLLAGYIEGKFFYLGFSLFLFCVLIFFCFFLS